LRITGDAWAEDPGCYLTDAEIGKRALARILRQHTYAHRGAEVDAFFRTLRGANRARESGRFKRAAAEGVF